MSIYYDKFISEWVKRAERVDAVVDIGDKFMSLWVAFNGWLKKTHGEKKFDRELIICVIKHEGLNCIFEKEKLENSAYRELLRTISRYTVMDMRDSDDGNRYKDYNGSFSSLIEVIYQIRCNLFHGRKSAGEDDKDRELVNLAYCLLRPLLKKQLEEEGLLMQI